jgi:hypothetical protein
MATQHSPDISGPVVPRLVGTVIVYGRNDGRVVHTVRFLHCGHGEPPTEAAMEQHALDRTKGFGLVAALHHKGEALKPHKIYRVDVTTDRPRLIEQEPARTDDE